MFVPISFFTSVLLFTLYLQTQVKKDLILIDNDVSYDIIGLAYKNTFKLAESRNSVYFIHRGLSNEAEHFKNWNFRAFAPLW